MVLMRKWYHIHRQATTAVATSDTRASAVCFRLTGENVAASMHGTAIGGFAPISRRSAVLVRGLLPTSSQLQHFSALVNEHQKACCVLQQHQNAISRVNHITIIDEVQSI